MVDLKHLQKAVYQNKVNKGFNITDVHKELCYLLVEVGEVVEAYNKKLPDLAEEIADVAIYLLGISEILGFDLEKEVVRKIDINAKRKYKMVNGALVKDE